MTELDAAKRLYLVWQRHMLAGKWDDLPDDVKQAWEAVARSAARLRLAAESEEPRWLPPPHVRESDGTHNPLICGCIDAATWTPPPRITVEHLTATLTATCEWCSEQLTHSGIWTSNNGGDYCPEGRDVGPTGTSPHKPQGAAPRAEGLDAATSLLRRWRDASLEGDASDLADLTDETTDYLASRPSDERVPESEESR